MPKPKEELDKWHGRGEASKIRILDVGSRLFVRQGFAATPVSQIARESGITVPSVYYHFGNKLGLFRAVVDAAGGLVAKDMEGVPPLPLREGLSALLERAVANMEAHIAGLRCRLLVSFQQDEDAKTLMQMMHQQRGHSIEIISAFCRDMLDRSDPWLAERSQLMATLYISGLQHICLDSMSEPLPASLLTVKKRLLIDSLVRVGEVENFPAFAATA